MTLEDAEEWFKHTRDPTLKLDFDLTKELSNLGIISPTWYLFRDPEDPEDNIRKSIWKQALLLG